jgi:hypothetical protein
MEDPKCERSIYDAYPYTMKGECAKSLKWMAGLICIVVGCIFVFLGCYIFWHWGKQGFTLDKCHILPWKWNQLAYLVFCLAMGIPGIIFGVNLIENSNKYKEYPCLDASQSGLHIITDKNNDVFPRIAECGQGCKGEMVCRLKNPI